MWYLVVVANNNSHIIARTFHSYDEGQNDLNKYKMLVRFGAIKSVSLIYE